MNEIFITGTDTGVGKTVISGLLGRYLLDIGYNVITQKWIQTGSKNFPQDIDLHLKLMQKKRQDIKKYLPFMSPYIFKFASSPYLAANLEKRHISIAKIKNSFKYLQKNFDFVIVEGIGGALVPLNENKLIIDIAEELRLPTLIVAGNKLGSINHTLLTVEAIDKREIDIIGIIFNDIYKEYDKVILRDNISIIRKMVDAPILGVLPHAKNKTQLYKAFISIGKRIMRHKNKKCTGKVRNSFIHKG